MVRLPVLHLHISSHRLAPSPFRRLVRDLLQVHRRPSGLFMDAIALSMFVEPAPVPTPRSEAPLLDASFDALVAAVSGEEPEVEEAPDTPSDDATSQPDLMS